MEGRRDAGASGTRRLHASIVPLVLTMLALAIRAPGLGRWCLAVDEYYFSRSVAFILEHGVPTFPGGGYYVRGILVQYLSTVPLALSASVELGIRLIPLAFAVLTVPALYALCRRFTGTLPAAVATTMLVLSSWHIEFSRFGRMFSAFQFVFILFLVFLHSGFWKGRRAHRWMALGLAFVAVLTHEGAIFMPVILCLALVNDERKALRDGLALAAAIGVLVAANYLVNGLDYRNLGVTDRLPAGLAAGGGRNLPVHVPSFELLATAVRSMGTLAGYVAVLGASAWTFRTLVRGARSAWTYVLAVLIVGSGALHQFGLLLSFALVLALCNRTVSSDLWARRFVVGAYVPAAVAFWFVVGVLSGEPLRETVSLVLLNAPYHSAIVFPFARYVPLWSALVLLGLLAAIVRLLVRRESDFPVPVTVLCLSLLPVLATPYFSTRYSFFFFPVVLLVLCREFGVLAEAVVGRFPRAAPGLVRPVVVALPLVGMIASEDFTLKHVVGVASPELNFRIGPYRDLAPHWYIRADYESPAAYVNRHAGSNDTVVVEPAVCSAYVDGTHTIYVDESTRRFRGIARARGTREIWTDFPLIHDRQALVDLVRERPGDVWLIAAYEDLAGFFVDSPHTPREIAAHDGFGASLESLGIDGRIAVWRLSRRPDPGAAAGGRDPE